MRTQLGFVLGGQTFSERWLIIDLENSPAPSRHTLVFCDAARPCIALPGPGATRRFKFKPQAIFRLLSAYPPARDYFAEMKYKPKPRFSKGFIMRDGGGAWRTPVGRLLPQPTVNDANGKRIRLDEALGDGFALLAITQPATCWL